MKRECGAVAVDLGASSGRFAAGWLEDDQLHFSVIEQTPHHPHQESGCLVWDLESLLRICRNAVSYAEANFERATLGIDSWGVDHGFLDENGKLLGNPVCYRDPSHEAAMRSIEEHQPRLYALTGIQRQPFNTLCQLIARRRADPTLPGRARWLILPDLLGYLLAGVEGYELTQASTTQMMGLDQNWAQEAFQIAGWPVPDLQPVAPGGVIAKLTESVDLVRVGSHDTASAVRGFGSLAEDEIFLNIGTWSIVGCLLERPLVSPEAESNNWSNEIAVDGRARFLKNVPGLYVVNRLHQELGVTEPIGTWLAAGCPDFGGRFDVFHPDLYNPEFMVQACSALVDEKPHSNSQWATAALGSLVDALAAQIRGLSGITGRTYRGLRVGGGGSQSPALCQALARATGFPVKAGPAEATVLGNLGVQFAASGRTSSLDAMLGHSRNLHYGSET